MASCSSRSEPGYNDSENAPLADGRDGTVLKPFQQTHLGRLPPELREQIYVELLATPPSYAGHDFAAVSPKPRGSSSAPRRFVHIKASWCQVMRTCRQIYVESYPIFFAQKSYYFGTPEEAGRLIQYFEIFRGPTPQEAGHLTQYYGNFRGPILRLDTITAICFRDLVHTLPLYTKEKIDEIMSDPIRSPFNTRQELENQTLKLVKISTLYNVQRLVNLKTISLCFAVGEELLYLDALYGFSGLRTGVVEFIDVSQWLIRPQNPEEPWNIQCACFARANYGKGKDNEDIPYDRRRIELEVTDIDSRAPGLKEGDERYVEVQIQWLVVEVPTLESRGSDEDDIELNHISNLSDIGSQDLLSDVDSQDQDSHEALLEVSQDPAADNSLTEHSEHDGEPAGLGSGSNGFNRSLSFGLGNEDGRNPQRATDTDQEEVHTLSQPLSEDVPSVQAGIQSDPPVEDPPMSTSGALTTHDASAATRDGQLSLLDTGDEDDQTETRPGTSREMTYAQKMQHWWYNNRAFTESIAETDQVQQGLRDGAKAQSRRSKFKHRSSLGSRPLPDISSMPCPYTEEEMESYEQWQEQSTSRNKGKAVELSHPHDKVSSPTENLQEHPEIPHCVHSNVADPQEEHSFAASQEKSGLLVTMYPAGVLLLLLFCAIITYQSERLSNVSPDSTGFGSQP